MPIVDNVLVGEGTVGEFPYPDESLGDYFEEIVKKNLASRGDAAWLVSIFLLNFQFDTMYLDIVNFVKNQLFSTSLLVITLYKQSFSTRLSVITVK